MKINMTKLIIIAVICTPILLIISSVIFGGDSSSTKNSYNQGVQSGKKAISPTISTSNNESFTRQDALEKIKGYELKENIESLGEPTVGMYLSVYLEKVVLQGMKIDSTANGGEWSAEDENNDGIYTVSYKFRTSGLDRIYTWEVGKDSIKAINGKAITITPELGPQEKEVSGTNNEKEIYEYSTGLYEKYESTLGSYEAETRATKETATKFGITEKEVENIIIKLQDSKL